MNAMTARAQRSAQYLASLSDERAADGYVQTLLDERNLQFSPYLVTAVRETKPAQQ